MILEYKKYLINWLKKEVKKANHKGVIIGMSGGVDSSVVATLAKEAFPNNSLGVFLIIKNMNKDLEDAKAVAKKINIKTIEINLTSAYKEIKKYINKKSKLAKANIKPRLRMTMLYALAQEKKYLVLGTDNLAEWTLGYFTKYGDGGVDLLPLVNLLKKEVKEMAKIMKLPKIIYTKVSTAGLWEGQTDENELGFSYNEIDDYIIGKKINPIIKEKIEKQIKLTNHKRIKIPTPKKIKRIKN